MHEETTHTDQDLPLELCGYEANTAQEVFLLTSASDSNLKRSLERNRFVHRADIVLADGRILDGWVKL